MGRTDYALIASLAMMFALMTSYTRARAESLIEKCKVGFMERPERIVLFMIGAFTNRMAGVLWVILVLSVFSVADRVILTYRVLERGTEERPRPLRAIAAAGAHAVERLLLDLRSRHLAVRRDGDRDPRRSSGWCRPTGSATRWRTAAWAHRRWLLAPLNAAFNARNSQRCALTECAATRRPVRRAALGQETLPVKWMSCAAILSRSTRRASP